MLAGLAVYAIRQKRRAEQAISLSKPFGNNIPNSSFAHDGCVCVYERFFPPFLDFLIFFFFFLQHLGLQVERTVEVHHS